VFGLDELARLVDIKLYTVDFAFLAGSISEVDVGLVGCRQQHLVKAQHTAG
jgi:hypothetical protein